MTYRTAKRLTVTTVAVVVAVLFVRSLPADGVPPLPKVPEVETRPTTTTLLDFSAISLPAVDGTTTTVPPPGIDGGTATLNGRVLAGGTPIGGATVEIVRFTGNGTDSKSTTVVSNPDGIWQFGNVQGGRFRVRAYRPPDLTADSGQVFFLRAGETKSMDLALNSFGGGIAITAAIAPSPPYLGQTANLGVSVTSQTVDNGGVARYIGQPNVPLVLTTAGGRAIVSTNPVATDRSGKATWLLRCDSLQGQQLAVTLPDGSQRPITVAACTPPPTTTTLLPPLVDPTTGAVVPG